MTGPATEDPRGQPAPRTLLITEWWLPTIGGSVNYYLNTYERYPEGTVRILTGEAPEQPGAPRSDLPVTRVSLQRYPFLRPESLALYWRMTRTAHRLVRQHDLQVLHCGHVFSEGMVAWMLHQTTRIPYVVYAHGEEVAIQRRYAAKRWWMPRIYNTAAAVIANSRNTCTLLEEVGVDPRRIHVINPGVDAERFHPVPREPDGCFRLLSVGRLQLRKGHDQVVRAVAALRDTCPDLVYDIAGDGEERPALEALVRELGLEDRVRFLGVVEDDDLPALYGTCDLFVLANRQLADDDLEGFGMVFLEAAASGRAVLGGATGGTADAVAHEHNGLLIDTACPDTLTDSIRRLHDDRDLLARLAAAGPEFARSGFDWNDISMRIRGLAGHA